MMTDQSSPDIVERLRKFAHDRREIFGPGERSWMLEAADEIECLRAAWKDAEDRADLYANSRPAAAQAVPEGWKLVPIEPTAEMIETGCDNNPTMFNEGTDNGFAADVANDVYVAMVRAAPAITSAQCGGNAE